MLSRIKVLGFLRALEWLLKAVNEIFRQLPSPKEKNDGINTRTHKHTQYVLLTCWSIFTYTSSAVKIWNVFESSSPSSLTK
jgi:hypothetical protein